MIRKELIFVDEKCRKKKDVLTFLISRLEVQGLVMDARAYGMTVMERESLGSTALGMGVAIPHGRSNGVAEAFVAYMKTERPFYWDETNSKPVQMIFLIGVPAQNGSNLHLKLLAEISAKLVDEQWREDLMACETVDEAYMILNGIGEF